MFDVFSFLEQVANLESLIEIFQLLETQPEFNLDSMLLKLPAALLPY